MRGAEVEISEYSEELLLPRDKAFVNDERLSTEKEVKDEKSLDEVLPSNPTVLEVGYGGKELCHSFKTVLQGQVHKDTSAEDVEDAV